MRTVRIEHVVATGAMMLLAASSLPLTSFAAEETGKIIEKLIVDVDKQLSALEDMADKQAGEKVRLNSELDKQFSQYDASQDEGEKAGLRGGIVNSLAKLNGSDRQEVKATVDTIVNVTEALRKIQSTAKNSAEFNPDKMKEQKVRIDRFVKNAARIVKVMEKANGDKSAQNRSVALKNSLIMLSRQLQDPVNGTEGALARIEETTRTLEDVAIQLHILQGLLENERVMLLTATHVQTVDLALLRLAKARLGAESVADIPAKTHEEIMARMKRARAPMMSTSSSLVSSTQPFDSDAWNEIADGE